MKTLFKKLSEENQKKVTETLNAKVRWLNTLDKFKKYIYVSDVDVYSAHQVFWAIYNNTPFDITKFNNLFK